MKQQFNALQKTKFASMAVVLAAAVFLPEMASAALVSGTATISLNGAWTSSTLSGG